jgi:ketosteroid isomerase-like protein
MTDSSSLTLAQQGFDAWRRGDFDALETIFAPDVECAGSNQETGTATAVTR